MKLLNAKYAVVILAMLFLFSCTKSGNSSHGWIEVGGTNKSTFNNYIACITIDSNGNVYAGGAFKDNDTAINTYVS